MIASRLHRAALAAGLAAFVAFGSSEDARAQGGEQRNPAAAEKLFNEAVEHEDKGDWEKACALYDASFKLDPSVGTQLNLGRCAEHFGKIATAWAIFQSARILNRETAGDQRKAEVTKFLDDADARLKARVPYVTIDVKNRPAGLTVTDNGAAVPVATLGVAIPVDPGKHEIVFRAPDFEEQRKTIEVAEATKSEVIVVELVAKPVVNDPKPVTGPKDSSLGGQVIAGIVIGAAGGLGLIAGGITGGLALARRGDLDELVEGDPPRCVENTEANQISCASSADEDLAEDLSAEGKTLAVTSTVMFVVGGALAATGLVVALTAPSSDEAVQAMPIVTPEFVGVVLSGRM